MAYAPRVQRIPMQVGVGAALLVIFAALVWWRTEAISAAAYAY